MVRFDQLRAGFSPRAVISVVVVLGLSGFLFATSARLARTDTRPPEDLPQLLSSESDRVEQLSVQAESLADEIAAIGEKDPQVADPNLSTAVGIQAGTVAVSGAGVAVTMADAPPGLEYDTPYEPNWLLVHQGDVQAVVNALWSGGAEVMTLQGQRVTPTSAFRCVGNTLLLHGRVFSPPYEIQVIGDPDRLQSALSDSTQVGIYLEAVTAYGLGWSVDVLDHIEIPKYEGSLTLAYAEPLAEES